MDEQFVQDGVTAESTGAETPEGQGQETQQGQPRDGQGRFAPQDGQGQQTQDAQPETLTVNRAEIEALQAQIQQAARAKEQVEIYKQALAQAQGGNVYTSGHPNPSAYNFQQPAQPFQQPQPASPPDPFDGLGDDDWVEAGKVKSAYERLQQSIQQQSQASNRQIQAITYAVMNPTAIQEIKESGIESDPLIINAARNSDNPLQTLHKYAKRLGGQAQQQQAAQPNQVADPLASLQKILTNTQKAGTPSQVGGAGSVSNVADRMAKMTDAEFRAYKQQVMDGQAKVGQL